MSLDLDPAAIAERLVETHGYPRHAAEVVAADLMELSPPVAAAFLAWWSSGVVHGVTVEGYTVDCLQVKFGMHPVAAYLTLEWLVQEPEQALAVLRHGLDRIGP